MYRSILCLVALNDECRKVLNQAQAMATALQADLHLLHVVEYVPLTGTEDAMLTAPISISDELEERSRQHMQKLATEYSVPEDKTRVICGDLVNELNAMIDDHAIDLVVVGNHRRKGLSAVFDHAEDTVLHRCSCDLLAVHLG